MRTFLRILAIAVGVVVVLLIAVAIAVSTIDVNTFVGPIQARVKQETGRDLAIRGGIELKLSLEPRLVVSDVTLGNASWGKAPALVSAKKVEVQVALLPLLQRRFEVIRLTLVEPTIALETDSSGKRNWDFSHAASSPAPPSPGTGSGLAVFGIGNLEVEKGALTFRDGANGKTTNVAIDRLVLAAGTPSSPVNAEFRGRIDDVAVAVTGNLGPLEALAQRKWPYPIALEGDVNGQKTTVETKLHARENMVGLDELKISVGQSKAAGEVTIATGGPRTLVTFKIAAATFALTDLPLPVHAADVKARATAPSAPSRWVFDDRPVSFGALRGIDADGDVSIDRLLLPEGRYVDGVRMKLALRDGVLDIPSAQVAAFGGTMSLRAHIDATKDPDSTLKLVLDAKGLDLAALALAAGVARDIKGGKTDVSIDLSMHGASLRQWAAGANGNVTAVVGPATAANPNSKEASGLDQIAQAVNPFRNTQPTTEIKCAVIRLPIKNGIAQIDRTLAAETRELGVSASGTLDFRNETLDLSIKPQAKQGIPIDLAQIANLVRVGGTFKSPAVKVDAAATAETVAKIGAVVSTGGWAAVAGTLLKAPGSGTTDTCDVALGRTPHAPPASASSDPASGQAHGKGNAKPVDEVGKALGKLFGR